MRVIPAQEQLSQVDCVLHPPHDPRLDIERGPNPGDLQLDWVAPPDNLHLARGGGSLDLLLTRFAGQVCRECPPRWPDFFLGEKGS